MLVDENDTHLNKDLGICRPCVDKVNSAYTFTKHLKTTLRDRESESKRFKRMTTSPLTPKFKPKSAVSVKKTKTRRALHETLKCNVGSEPPQVEPRPSLQGQACSQSGSVIDSVIEPVCPPILEEHTYSQAGPGSSACVTEHGYSQTQSEVHSTTVSDRLSATAMDHLQQSFRAEDEGRQGANDVINKIVNEIVSNQVVMKAVQARLLKDIDIGCSTLVWKNAALGSALSRYRSTKSLVEHGDHLLDELIREMSERVPFLLDIFTIVSTAGREPTESKIAPVAAAYSILMNARHNQLSAWHRLTTFVAIKGHLDDSALLRLNHLGVTKSPSTKLRLLDEAGEMMTTGIASKLVTNPLVKVTGDNLDIYIRTGHKSLDRSNKDLHLFASNLLFSRIAKPGQYSLAADPYPLARLRPEMFFPRGHFRETLRHSYCVLLGRILVEMKAFSWLFKSVLPVHIYHPYHKQMSQKSDVFQLPILMKNEAKHEDCVDILDEYESVLGDIFVQSFGSEDLLQKFKVPVGGDQLTRVRLEEAKNLRTLATTPKKRFHDLHPFVIELWHVKQDYLEKCYEELYNSATLRQPGTLHHYKAQLQRSDVNGKVKGNFKSHHRFLLLVGKEMIREQFMEYFGMNHSDDAPTKNVPTVAKSRSDKEKEMCTILESFMAHYRYLNDAHDESDIQSHDQSGTVFNYASNRCHWVVQLMMIEDIEGDVVRLIPCLMNTLTFFFSHSRLSKYFVECLDFILKAEFMLSPMQRMRVLEGAFTNRKGGIGNNMEGDLVQENSDCNQT